jgi:nucleoside-diphosphate-sugar epimerase
MKVLITGGTGFIGQRLALRLLERGELTGSSGDMQAIDELVLFDQTVPEGLSDRFDDSAVAVTVVAGDIADKDVVGGLIDRDNISVFHLASVVSGGGERDFDLAMQVNLDGGLNVLEALRARNGTPKLVFASSIAVFGGRAMPERVGDMTKQVPQTTYGVTKAINELLINDYSRKGFLDGRSARLPTVIIRPGAPNAAASSFASAVMREPLKGIDYVLPVRPETAMPSLGYRAVVDGIIALHELPGEALGEDRAVGLPSLRVTVADMIEALQRVAGNRPLGRISVEPDPAIEAICATWPQGTIDDRALDLGLPSEHSIDEMIAYYIEDYVDGA